MPSTTNNSKSQLTRREPEIQVLNAVERHDLVEPSDVLPYAPAEHRGGMRRPARQDRNQIAWGRCPDVARVAKASNRRGDKGDVRIGIEDACRRRRYRGSSASSASNVTT